MKRPRIAFTAWSEELRQALWNEEARDTLARLGWDLHLLGPCESIPSLAEWQAFFKDADAIVTTWRSPRLDNRTLALNERLKFVGHAGGSVAQVVSEDLFNRGVRVSCANQEMAATVARWGLMMTLVGLRGLLYQAQLGTYSGIRWNRRSIGRDPRVSTIGIWGYGDISRKLIELLRPLQPRKILICSQSLGLEDAAREGLEKVTLEELFARSNVIHLLQSLTPKSEGAVGRAHLESMPEGAVLINAGRAHLVQEGPLLETLKSGRIHGIFDTHYEEPLPEEYPFYHLPNVILTPHCAGDENHNLYVKLMLEECQRLFNNESLEHEVSRSRALTMTVETIRASKPPSLK